MKTIEHAINVKHLGLNDKAGIFFHFQSLRAVPTIVIAHTFFLSVMFSNTVIFLRCLKLSVESRSL